MGKTAETMGILLGISCGASASLPVDIPIYQGFCCPKPVCRKFLANYFLVPLVSLISGGFVKSGQARQTKPEAAMLPPVTCGE